MRKIYFLFLACHLLFIGSLKAQVPGNELFDNKKIHNIKIVPLYENLYDTLTNNYILSFNFNQNQTRDIPYSPAKLIIDGIALDSVGIRFKGFNSWWHSVKKPIKIDINKYKEDQNYDGLKKINLHNGSGDPSFLRENIDYKILRLMGIKVPRTSYAKLFIDTSYVGFYRLVEQVDNTFLDVNFGMHDGNLYVQQSMNSSGFNMEWRGNKQDLYYEAISLENHKSKNDWFDFIHFLDVVNNSPDNSFADSIVTVFDVESFLQILAFDVATGNMDFYGNAGRNYYLYNLHGKFQWIPWDYNLTWRENSEPLNIDPLNYPILIKRLLQVPQFYDSFLHKYCILKPFFSGAFINNLITDEATAISTYLLDDPYIDYPFEAFQSNIDSTWLGIPGLTSFAANLNTVLSSTLNNLNIQCSTSSEISSSEVSNFQLYPVPSDNWVQIGVFPNRKLSVTIFNSYGQLVNTSNLFEEGKVNTSRLQAGSYIVKVFTGEKVYSKALLVFHQ